MGEREDTGFKYPDGTPVYVGDRLYYDNEVRPAKVYGRDKKNGRCYFLVVYVNSQEQRQIILDKVRIRARYYTALKEKREARKLEIKAKAPNPKRKYIHGFLDYDHLEVY